MAKKRVMFSPVTRLEGLLSVEVTLDGDRVVNANASSTAFRGFEWIMRDRHITDAVYMTQRICGICSTAHGAVASYLLDELYDNTLSENAQLMRNIMYASDIIQNHIRHFYLFGLPDYVRMPQRPPFHGQHLSDARLNPEDDRRLLENYFEAIKVSQKSHEILALFGGKAPHQHSFVHGGVSVAPTADKINRALALAKTVSEFVKGKLVPDTELIARAYSDYYQIGVTEGQFLSFGLFRFGPKNERLLLKNGVQKGNRLIPLDIGLINEDITSSWFSTTFEQGSKSKELIPNPYKPGAYTWSKSVTYGGQHYEVGPLARMIINGKHRGGASTMDRIYARTLETVHFTQLMEDWLKRLKPGPAPIEQKKTPVKNKVVATTDAMRGALLHSAWIEDEQVVRYNIITPSVWNFSPKDEYGRLGPTEGALVGTVVPRQEMLFNVLGRIIRSFDPCLQCATHVLDMRGNVKKESLL